MDVQPQRGGLRAPTAAVILAAGKSTRMRSAMPKPLHTVCGLPMTAHVIEACRQAGVERVVVVVGHEAERVRAGLGDGVEYALQTEQRGTADAVRSALPLLERWPGDVLILAGDTPLLLPSTLDRLMKARADGDTEVALLTAFLDDATGYGRIVRSESGSVCRIVEERDATPEERRIREWSPSIYVFRQPSLVDALAEVGSANAQGEFYLTDTIAFLAGRGCVESVAAHDTLECLGVNTRVELAKAEELMRQRILTRHMLAGVTVRDAASTYVDARVEIGQDTVLEPGTQVLGDTVVGQNCVLGPHSRIDQCTIEDGAHVVASWATGSVVGAGANVGPFSQLRAGTRIGARARIGNFVEVKNSTLGQGVSASHLSYIGDADVGERTNIGAGTVFCNYDGFEKHRTVVGRSAFIGSHSTLIAPLRIGDGAITAAGSPLGVDIPDDAMAIARCRPTVKEGKAAAYRARRAAELSAEHKSSGESGAGGE